MTAQRLAPAEHAPAPVRFRAHLLRLVLAVVLPLLALAAGLALLSAEARREAALREMDRVTLALQLAVDREFALVLAMLEALATSPVLDAALAEGQGGAAAAAFHAQARALVAARPAALSVIWLIPAVPPSAPAPAPIVSTLVAPDLPAPPVIATRFPPRPIGAPPEPGTAYRAAAAGEAHIGDLARGSLAGFRLPVTLPVRRNGQVVAVLGAGMLPEWLGTVLQAQMPETGGIAAVIDRGGVIAARNTEAARWVGEAAAEELLTFQRDPAATSAVQASRTVDGRPVYAALRRLSAAPFAVAFGAAREAVDRPVYRLQLATAGIGLLALALAVAGALALGRRMGREVARLGEDALAAAHGRAPPARPASRIAEVAAAGEALRNATAALADSEARFRRAVAAARMGTWEWDVAGNRLTGSPGQEALYGRATGELATREAVLAAIHPDDRATVEAATRRAFAGERDGLYVAEFRALWPDGTERWLRSQGRAEFDAGGQPLRMSGAVVDVTDRRLAEAALRESERRLRLAQDAAGIGAWDRDIATGMAHWSEQQYRLFGLDPSQPPPDPATLRKLMHPDDRRISLMSERLRERGIAGEQGAAEASEYRIHRADTGELRWLQVLARALPGPDGRPVRVVGVSLDVTARRAAEERQALLMREVDHRAKNALAVALSVVQLAPRDLPPEEFAAGVSGRIAAMARAHSLLAAEGWAGAELLALAEGELAAHVGRVQLSGPPLRLAAAAAQPVAMLLHELATNAAKHGALSTPAGRVAVSWRVEGGDLVIAWTERGGPPLPGPPRRTGFGTRLLNALARQQLGGALAFDWSDPQGLRVALHLPAPHLVDAPVTVPSAASVPVAGGQLGDKPLRVLVVEDEALLALQVEEWLRSLGCHVLGPARNLAEALRQAAADPPPDLALLDVNLGAEERVFPVVDVLRTRGVPVVFATGYAGTAALEGHVEAAAAVLHKPYAREALAAALRRATGGGQG